MAIKVIIVDDHPYFQAGLNSILASEKDIITIGETSDEVQALRSTVYLLQLPHSDLMRLK